MYDLEFLPAAQRDLVQISKYIAKTLQNPIAAMDVIDRMIQTAEDLRRHPYICPAYYPPHQLKFEYRKLIVGNYILFYRVSEQKKCITVVRVIYAKRDYSAIIAGTDLQS